MRQRSFSTRTLVLITLLLTGCRPVETADRLTAWIDAPLDGLTLPPGQLITVQGHAAGPSGVSRIEIWVNGVLTIEQADPPEDGGLAHFDHVLLLDSPGDWAIELVPFGGAGAAGVMDEIVLHVIPFTLTATETPALATASAVPTGTATATPPPPDREGPPAPAPISPTGGQSLACQAQAQLTWGDVSDRSGIAEYRVQAERHAGDGNWQPVAGSPWGGLTQTSLSIPVECGWYYRWRVVAVDGVGNIGGFSSWATFAVPLT